MSFITCENLSFAYDGVPAVSGISFSLNSGDYLCVVGENGSGKSTLVRGLLRQKAAQSGSLEMDKELWQGGIGYLPQQSAVSTDFPASVYEVVLSGRLAPQSPFPFYTRKDKEAAKESMRRFDVLPLIKRCFRELSGGQQRRVLLARALCAKRKLLILDEPAAGLDPLAAADLYRLLEQINRDEGLALIMVTHDIAAALRYASHILHLGSTQLFFGGRDDYLESNLGKAFWEGGQR